MIINAEQQEIQHEHCWPRPGYAWYVVVVLTLAYVVSMIDRQILSLLVEPVKQDLHINDTAFGLLHGFAFGLFYTLVGIPIAWLADHSNRRRIIITGVFLWSLLTAACGLARGFTTLFLARMGVGIGEAALAPSVLSMLSDMFPRERLHAPISLYTNGAYWGTGMAFILGGAVVQLVTQHPVTELPVLGAVRSWQLTFFFVSIPGFLLLPLLFTIKEPMRRSSRGLSMGNSGGLRDYLRENINALAGLYLGMSLLVLVTVSLFVWTPALFIRRFDWSAGNIGYVFGVIVLVFGTAGINLGGLLTDRLVQRGMIDAPLRVAATSAIGVVPFLAIIAITKSSTGTLVLLAPVIFLISFPAGAGMAAIQAIVPNQFRARMTAVFVLVSNLVAMLLGPPLVGLMTDYVFGSPGYLGEALASVCGVACVLSSIIMIRALGAFRVTFSAQTRLSIT